MKILLTPDQQSTLWHLMETILCPSGETVYSFPYYLKPCGDGEFERLRFDQLSEEVKDQLLTKQGIKLPEPKGTGALDWLKEQDGILEITSFLYNFNYNGIKCAGLLTTSIWGDSVRIQPILSTDDIGEGAGCGIVKKFERN